MMRLRGVVRLAMVTTTVLLMWYMATQLLDIRLEASFRRDQVTSQSTNGTAPRPVRFKCGLTEPCPDKHFSFRVVSGSASIVGPKICFEDVVLMSSIKNNVGRGLNFAVVNGVTGALLDVRTFDMWAGDVEELLKFLRTIQRGSIVLVATFDDGATKLSVEARQLLSHLGSTAVNSLAFRDSWVFVGAQGIYAKSPFELHVRNNQDTNKYEGWPEALELEGCVPVKEN
ncbi:protein FAM3C-like isoform X1 [Petromyzon marinus]|uniref:Protein FAM3C-like isoform X1 n=2 Tax=Petromyzon marinus TaxID=7757 RepID=A0AAJ7U224_PETMA|nr:protein FAM3C-like isoform X1 [Petromyzon marinus]XP_032828402.1 protein FAM3C-like isoform X1 [Petromyzon marinus]